MQRDRGRKLGVENAFDKGSPQLQTCQNHTVKAVTESSAQLAKVIEVQTQKLREELDDASKKVRSVSLGASDGKSWKQGLEGCRSVEVSQKSAGFKELQSISKSHLKDGIKELQQAREECGCVGDSLGSFLQFCSVTTASGLGLGNEGWRSGNLRGGVALIKTQS